MHPPFDDVIMTLNEQNKYPHMSEVQMGPTVILRSYLVKAVNGLPNLKIILLHYHWQTCCAGYTDDRITYWSLRKQDPLMQMNGSCFVWFSVGLELEFICSQK